VVALFGKSEGAGAFRPLNHDLTTHAVSSRAQRVWGPTQVGYAESRDLLLLFVLHQGMSSLMPQSAPKAEWASAPVGALPCDRARTGGTA
jgi:hypothetical protein